MIWDSAGCISLCANFHVNQFKIDEVMAKNGPAWKKNPVYFFIHHSRVFFRDFSQNYFSDYSRILSRVSFGNTPWIIISNRFRIPLLMPPRISLGIFSGFPSGIPSLSSSGIPPGNPAFFPMFFRFQTPRFILGYSQGQAQGYTPSEILSWISPRISGIPLKICTGIPERILSWSFHWFLSTFLAWFLHWFSPGFLYEFIPVRISPQILSIISSNILQELHQIS